MDKIIETSARNRGARIRRQFTDTELIRLKVHANALPTGLSTQNLIRAIVGKFEEIENSPGKVEQWYLDHKQEIDSRLETAQLAGDWESFKRELFADNPYEGD